MKDLRFLLPILLLITCGFVIKPTHDMPLAFFNLNMETETTELTILLDKADFDSIIGEAKTTQLPRTQIERYLLENMKWFFNQKQAVLEVCTIEQREDHYQVKTQFPESKRPISTIKVINSCLVNEIEDHSNILQVSYAGKQRTFRLHKSRQQTFFELI